MTKLGYIGLGRMGKNMVLRLLEQGQEIVAWNRSPEPLQEVVAAGAEKAESVEDLVKKLETPRIVWLMLPAGEVTDQFIDQVLPFLEKDDLLIDGANSFYKDTLRREKKITAAGVHFMDIGVSGGPGGARSGACLMIGGSEKDYDRVSEIVKAASAPEAFGHFGGVGAGHFAKMVHNGIEYGMMEAIGEGAAILKSAPFELNLPEIFRVYNKRSVIESRLVEWTLQALQEDPNLTNISSTISSTGEGEWTIKTGKEFGVEVPVIEKSFAVRQNSGKDKEDSSSGFRNKVVSAMRGKFGQHEVKK
jgi:6-phosphogluconate dehydrogenase